MTRNKILVLEDHRASWPLYKTELGRDGYRVRFASSGMEGLRQIAEETPDLVILDMSLPDLSGMEVLGVIAEMSQDLKVVIHSAYPCYKQDFKAWAADAYVVKSNDLAELKSAIRSLLPERSSLPEPASMSEPEDRTGSCRRWRVENTEPAPASFASTSSDFVKLSLLSHSFTA